jgi:hypothetical protein
MNQKIVCSVLLCVSAFIVLPVVRSVNVSDGNPVLATPSIISEGDPMPPPHRPCCALVSEGDPMPPPHRPGVAV